MVTRYDISEAALAVLLENEPKYRVSQVWEGLYRNLAMPAEMTNLPASLRETLESLLPCALETVVERMTDDGETTKWLFRLDDGAEIETVLMAYDDRVTVCVSTQAGCAMACDFCATGQAGFTRQLTTGEIVEQVITAAQRALPRRLSNVVFMGMGEPLANYERLWAAIHRLHDDLGLSARHLTISTVGIVPGINKLASADLPVNLAVSLHAANDEARSAMLPINKRYPLAMLAEACKNYFDATGRRLSFEWALISGVNDTDEAATELSNYARLLHAHVNLIPLNPTPGYGVLGSSPRRVREFRDRLVELGVNATIRSTRGVEIDAACGQLAAATKVRLRERRR